jgi:predicted transcriptional regulator YheO
VTWRVGEKIPINVYDGDRPVCQCHTAIDARRIVQAVNALLENLPVERETLKAIAHRTIVEALDECGTIAKAAKRLGMGRSSLYAYLDRNKGRL